MCAAIAPTVGARTDTIGDRGLILVGVTSPTGPAVVEVTTPVGILYQPVLLVENPRARPAAITAV